MTGAAAPVEPYDEPVEGQIGVGEAGHGPSRHGDGFRPFQLPGRQALR